MPKNHPKSAGNFLNDDDDPFAASNNIDHLHTSTAGEDADTWEQFKKQRRQDESRPFQQHKETEVACIKCCFFIPKLPKSSTFKRWLPKHRHILFGHFGYWIVACLTSAASGTSLNLKCSESEAIVLFVCLILTSLMTGLPKLFSADGFKRGFGPTVLSFLIMFSTGLSLHQKPLICGFPNNTRRRTTKSRANQWAIVMSVQIMILLLTIMCYAFWHLKHKDEKRTEAEAGNEDEDKVSSGSEDEDSMAASPASVRWTTGQRADHV